MLFADYCAGCLRNCLDSGHDSHLALKTSTPQAYIMLARSTAIGTRMTDEQGAVYRSRRRRYAQVPSGMDTQVEASTDSKEA